MALNRTWHRDNRMPPRATREQRIKWHVAHAKVCACRPVPDSIRLDVDRLFKAGQRKNQSMIRKSVKRFSEKIMLKQRAKAR